LSLDQIEEFYSKKSGSYTEEDFESDLSGKQVKIILEKLEKMASDGIDLVAFRESLLNFFQKKILVCFKAAEGEPSKLSLKDLETWINLLIRAAKQEKETEIDQLPLELAVIDFIGDEKGVIQIEKEEPKREDKKVEEIKIEKKAETRKEEVVVVEDNIEEEKVVTVDIAGLTLDKIVESWGNILIAVKPFNHSVEAFLRAARPVEMDGRKLVLEVFYPFHKDRLEEPRNRKIVEEGLLKVLGVELVFECVLGENKKPALVIQNDTPVEEVSEQLANDKKDGEKEKKQDLYDVAKDIFG